MARTHVGIAGEKFLVNGQEGRRPKVSEIEVHCG